MIFKEIQKAIDEVANDLEIQILALNAVVGVIKNRIHNQGKDSENNQLGKARGSTKYSPLHKKNRTAKGRQVSKIDLQFTDNLFNSYQVGLSDGKAVIGFRPQRSSDFDNSLTNSELAFILEEMFKTDIWKPTKEELKLIEDQLVVLVDKRLKKVISNIKLAL